MYDAIKLNVNATWGKGISSMVMIARNHEGDVMRLWYDNYCCASSLATKLLAIKKAFMVLDHFPRWKIQVKNDSKIAVKALLGLSPCSWRSVLVFEWVLSFVSKLRNKIGLL